MRIEPHSALFVIALGCETDAVSVSHVLPPLALVLVEYV